MRFCFETEQFWAGLELRPRFHGSRRASTRRPCGEIFCTQTISRESLAVASTVDPQFDRHPATPPLFSPACFLPTISVSTRALVMTIVQFLRLLRASVADSHISHHASRPESSPAPFDLEQLLLGITERAYSEPLFFDLPNLRPNRVRVFTDIFLAQRASHRLLDHRIACFA